MKKIMKNGKINGLLDVYGIIYLVKNKVNGKCYIGQTVKKNGFRDRYGVGNGRTMIESFYKAHKKNNSSSDIILEDMEKYGLNAFEVDECIDYAFSKTELDIKERTYISVYKSMISNSYDNYYVGGYNKTSGGSGAKDYKWSEESKQKLKETKNTPEALERSREAAKKENLSPETLKQRSESLKGHCISDDTKLLISDCIEKMWEDGKYNSEEVRKNMSDGQKRRWEDEDNKIKASEATKKNWEDDNYREKVIDGLKEYWDDEDNRKKHSARLKEAWENNEDGKEKISEAIKKKWEDNDFRERVTNGLKEYWDNEDNRKKHGEKMKKCWDKDKKEEWCKIQKEIQNRIDVKEKKSNTMTKKWQDEEYKTQVSDTLSKKWENEEYRNNVVNGMKKAWENEDLRKQQSKATKGGKNPRAKAVICISSVEKNYDRKIFAFMGEAAQWAGKKCNCSKTIYNKIARCCEGKIDFCGKMLDGTLLKWRYLKDLNEEELKELLNEDLTGEEKEIVQKQLK